MRSDRANRRSPVSTADKDAVTSGDDATGCFARSRLRPERLIMDTLFDFELPNRLGRVRRLINVCRHATIYIVRRK